VTEQVTEVGGKYLAKTNLTLDDIILKKRGHFQRMPPSRSGKRGPVPEINSTFATYLVHRTRNVLKIAWAIQYDRL